MKFEFTPVDDGIRRRHRVPLYDEMVRKALVAPPGFALVVEFDDDASAGRAYRALKLRRNLPLELRLRGARVILFRKEENNADDDDSYADTGA